MNLAALRTDPHAVPQFADPDTDIVPPERCECGRHRRTVHRCTRCGRPVCFHCQTPHIGGQCAKCYDATPPLRLKQRLAHGGVAISAALVAASAVAATLMRWIGR